MLVEQVEEQLQVQTLKVLVVLVEVVVEPAVELQELVELTIKVEVAVDQQDHHQHQFK